MHTVFNDLDSHGTSTCTCHILWCMQGVHTCSIYALTDCVDGCVSAVTFSTGTGGTLAGETAVHVLYNTSVSCCESTYIYMYVCKRSQLRIY